MIEFIDDLKTLFRLGFWKIILIWIVAIAALYIFNL